ncbi:Cyclic nucleotide-binding domain-containing protein [Psidium guajava]|nr:Cyclic nucleotide-binding domain-containing protein [Psidium guajava]
MCSLRIMTRRQTIRRWNRVFLTACLVCLFVDTLFFYVPSVDGDHLCLYGGLGLKTLLTTVRSVANVFYIVQITVRFNTALLCPLPDTPPSSGVNLGNNPELQRLEHNKNEERAPWLISKESVGQVCIQLDPLPLGQPCFSSFLVPPLCWETRLAGGWPAIKKSHRASTTSLTVAMSRTLLESTNLQILQQVLVLLMVGHKQPEFHWAEPRIYGNNLRCGINILHCSCDSWAAFARAAHWRYSRVPSSSKQPKRAVEAQEDRERAMDAPQTSASTAETICSDFPVDLHRNVNRHLCFDLIRRVPLFNQMDERMLDAICERRKPVLCTGNMYLVREGDPLQDMFFIIRGQLDSSTTNGGRTGFFNLCRLVPADFGSEELLTWARDPQPSIVLPSSTRTAKALKEVEAFPLAADDLNFVASQFRRLHNKELRHKFRFYSHQWRTWAACFIRSTWRRHRRSKEEAELREDGDRQAGKLKPSRSFWDVYARELIESTGRDEKRAFFSNLGLIFIFFTI